MVECAGVFTPDAGSGRVADPSLPAVESNLSSAGASGGPREKTGRNTAGYMGNTSLGDRAKKQTRTAPGFDPAPGGRGGRGGGSLPDAPPYDEARRCPPGPQCGHLLQQSLHLPLQLHPRPLAGLAAPCRGLLLLQRLLLQVLERS